MTKTVLIIDDDKLIRESLGAMLISSGHSVLQAQNGQEGLSAAIEHQPNLVITDIRMPVMTGLEMVERLRQDDWGKTVPVIILTNDETTDAINHALETGVTVYLSKVNLDPESFKQQVLMALG